MRKIFLLFLLLFVLTFVLVACVKVGGPSSGISPEKFKFVCSADSDCICGGIDKSTKDCFVGNKDYYESGAVDKEKYCPDFCTGIAGNIITKCVENKCVNVNKNTFPECRSDSDCVPSDCFHASSCVPKSKAPKCEDIFGTTECRQGTLDCGGSCACDTGRCTTKNLYQKVSDVLIV